MSEPERYESILRLAWSVGWATARRAYVETQRRSGRSQAALHRELLAFDRLYREQASTGVDPVAALHQRDLNRFVARPIAAILGFGVAALCAKLGVDLGATMLNAGLTFGLADVAARALVARAVGV